MASNADFVQYIADQCSGAGEIVVRKIICDNGFYLKPTDAVRPMLREVALRPPYDGAKDYFYITDIDDRDYLSALVRETCKALPSPRPKKKK